MVNAQRTGLAATLATAMVVTLAPGPARGQPSVPQIAHPVTDLAEVLGPADEEALAARLVAHRAATEVLSRALDIEDRAGCRAPVER